jgi:cell division protein FtsL
MPKTIGTIFIIFLAILILVGLFKQINSALLASSRLDQAAEEVTKLQDKNRQLKNKLSEVQNPDFVEEVARDKLGLSRPNETVVVVPQEAINRVLAANIKIEEIKIPNWQGWLRLLKLPF